MTETSLDDTLGDYDEPLPYRAIEGLRVSVQSKGQRGPRNYVVRAPNGNMCQLGEEENFLLTRLDGRHSFAEIAEEFRDRFDETLSPEHFQSFVDELQSAGIVMPAENEVPVAEPPLAASKAGAAAIAFFGDGAAAPVAEHGDLTSDVVPAADTIPLYTPVRTLAPFFQLLARVGSPLRYFVWLLIPAPVLLGVLLYGQAAQMNAALSRPMGWLAALGCLGAVLAALLIPNLVRGTVVAFHGAPAETFRLTLAGYVFPWFRIDRGWRRTLSRKAQVWSYGAPLLARLALFVVGASLWRFSGDPTGWIAVTGLCIAGAGLWSFLLTAMPLWAGDGRRFIATYFDELTLDRAPWLALRIDRAAGFEIRGRGFYILAALISVAGIAGAAVLWGVPTWDGISLILGAVCDLVRSGFALVAAALPQIFGPIGDFLSSRFDGISRALSRLLATTSSWFATLRETAGGETVHKTGAMLLGGADAVALLWLAAARLKVGSLRLAAHGGWDGAVARSGGQSADDFLPMGRGPGRALAPSLDERLYAGSRQWPSDTKVLILAALIVGGLSVAFLAYPYESGGSFTILPYTNYELDARVPGEVTEVMVREGQWVEEGQVVGTLSDWNAVHNLAVAKAGLEKANAQLQDLLILPKPEQVILARTQFEQAAARLPFSKADYERDLSLVKTGAISIRQFEQSQSTYEQDKAAVAVLRANYDLVRIGATQTEIEAARASVRLAAANVSYAEDQLARTRIRATAPGTVVTPNPQLMYGKFLNTGQTFVMLQDNRVAHVEVMVPEADIRDIRVGNRVRAKAWGYEYTTWIGKVTLIAHDVTSSQQLGNVVRVVAEIPNTDLLLRPQMSGYAKVQTVEMPVWVSFTRALVRFVLIELWSWIP